MARRRRHPSTILFLPTQAKPLTAFQMVFLQERMNTYIGALRRVHRALRGNCGLLRACELAERTAVYKFFTEQTHKFVETFGWGDAVGDD
ncbi:hypothetical protein K438DRAFT_1980399 [Mycena galopus ATCC 62051]|nr:hypothetical protein K438DRAFT_1980399 [Mycena galopus ATCC 62051]